MRPTGKRWAWLASSLVMVLLLAACNGAATQDDPGPTVGATPVPSRADPAVVELAGNATAGGDNPAPMASLEAPLSAAEEETILTEDDRPAGLKNVTAGWNTNWNKHTIEYDDLLSGGPPRDGIPSIDEPHFVLVDEAAGWLADNEPVIALEIDGDARAYPLQILTWHEIVNDVVGGVPVAATFCPLCNSAITFDRRLGDEVLEFGTSGLLRNSDLVMYDWTTESLWQQLTGEAIVGDLAGEQLAFLPSAIVSAADFRET